MKLDVSKEHLLLICNILKNYNDLDFYAFGSRVKGSAKKLSDLDLVIKSPVDKVKLSSIREDFEESRLPYKIDLVVWDDITDSFKKNIETDLLCLRTCC